MQEQGYSHTLAARLDRLDQPGQVLNSVEAENETVGPGFAERIDPVPGLCCHEMNLERQRRLLPERATKSGKKSMVLT